MIDIQAIKSKILDLAMRGQVTEQLPEEGTADVLYTQIQSEITALIESGKVKQEKPLPEISAEEYPFQIPNSWRWVYLGELFHHNTGKALNASVRQGEMMEYITTSNLYWDHFELDDLKQMPFTESEVEKYTVTKGDLLVCEGGDIGRSAIWPFDYDMRIQNHIHKLRKYSNSICTEFYYYLLWYYKLTGRINGIGIGLQGFSSKRVHSLIVPLVPYNEATRIVQKIQKAFAILDNIDAIQIQYADNRAVLKSKLIDAAIQGKLTEQLPDDGTAEELYQQIQVEKLELAKAGKIKKEKPLPEITEDEIPFEIPDNWKWVRLASICRQITDGTHKTPTYQKEGIPFLSVKNISSGYLDLSDIKYIPKSEHDELIKRCQPQKNDVLICRIGTLGKALRIDTDLEFSIFVSLGLVKTGNQVLSDHLVSVINSEYGSNWIQSIKAGGAMHAYKINLTDLNMLPVPLPPLAEQKRIAEKLDEALRTFDVQQ